MKVTATLDDKALQEALKRLSGAAADLTPAMKSIAGTLLAETERNFQAQGRPKWRPLKNPPKHREGGMVLQDTAQLASSISARHSATEAIVGTNKVYAAIHQMGGTIKRAAYRKQVRHKTDKKGNLKRTARFGGKGLVFAKNKDKHALTRWFEVAAHAVEIPARPFLPISGGTLQPEVSRALIETIRRHLVKAAGG